MFTSNCTILITIKGPPTLNDLGLTRRLVAGDAFTLSCTANDDPQSPDGVHFVWYQDDNDITSATTVIANSPKYTSQLNIQQLDSDHHSGHYSCVAYNHPSAYVTSSTTLIIES